MSSFQRSYHVLLDIGCMLSHKVVLFKCCEFVLWWGLWEYGQRAVQPLSVLQKCPETPLCLSYFWLNCGTMNYIYLVLHIKWLEPFSAFDTTTIFTCIFCNVPNAMLFTSYGDGHVMMFQTSFSLCFLAN